MPTGIYPGNKGRTPWNKGKKTGIIPKTAFKKGNINSPEYIERSRLRMIGNKFRLGLKPSVKTRTKMSKSHRGDKCHFWKGGISRVKNYKHYNCIKYKLWRSGIFERDNWICQTCGKRSCSGDPIYLEAHHIIRWSLNKKLRYTLNNGVTLCKECHKNIHKK